MGEHLRYAYHHPLYHHHQNSYHFEFFTFSHFAIENGKQFVPPSSPATANVTLFRLIKHHISNVFDHGVFNKRKIDSPLQTTKLDIPKALLPSWIKASSNGASPSVLAEQFLYCEEVITCSMFYWYAFNSTRHFGS